MKPFLLVAFLGLLGFGADAHRTANGRSPDHYSRQFSSSRYRMDFMGPGGHGWRQRYPAYSIGKTNGGRTPGKSWNKGGGRARPDSFGQAADRRDRDYKPSVSGRPVQRVNRR